MSIYVTEVQIGDEILEIVGNLAKSSYDAIINPLASDLESAMAYEKENYDQLFVGVSFEGSLCLVLVDCMTNFVPLIDYSPYWKTFFD